MPISIFPLICFITRNPVISIPAMARITLMPSVLKVPAFTDPVNENMATLVDSFNTAIFAF